MTLVDFVRSQLGDIKPKHVLSAGIESMLVGDSLIALKSQLLELDEFSEVESLDIIEFPSLQDVAINTFDSKLILFDVIGTKLVGKCYILSIILCHTGSEDDIRCIVGGIFNTTDSIKAGSTVIPELFQ